MKTNITEEKLMSYLYGELKAHEREEVEAYLRSNPEKQRELEAFGEVRTIMGIVKDDEDIPYPIIPSKKPQKADNLWKYVAVAASVAFFMISGLFAYTVFGDKDGKQTTLGNNLLTRSDLKEILDSQREVTSQNLALIEKIDRLERELATVSQIQNNQDQQLASFRTSLDKKETNEQVVQKYFSSLQQENKEWLDEYFNTMNAQQQERIENMLVDFGEYINEQRRQDFQFLQARLQNLEEDTDEFKNQTVEIMASLAGQESAYEKY